MKVKVDASHPYSNGGETIEVSSGMAEYMENTGTGTIVEKDGEVAHDMGTPSIIPSAHITDIKPPKKK